MYITIMQSHMSHMESHMESQIAHCDISTIVREMFAEGYPLSSHNKFLLPVGSDPEMTFEILISFLMEFLVYVTDGNLNISDPNTDDENVDLAVDKDPYQVTMVSNLITSLEPYFEALGYDVILTSRCLSDAQHINKIWPYRYCKVKIKSKEEQHEDESAYTFLLNPATVKRTKLDEYYAVLSINRVAYKVHFLPIS